MSPAVSAIRRTVLVFGAVVGLAAIGWLYKGHLADSVDRGMAGIEPSVPGHVTLRTVDGGPSEAYRVLLELSQSPGGESGAGVVYPDGNVKITLLFDPVEDLLDERRISSGGTVIRTLWRGDPMGRLRWGVDSGALDLPGSPPAERRNLYH